VTAEDILAGEGRVSYFWEGTIEPKRWRRDAESTQALWKGRDVSKRLSLRLGEAQTLEFSKNHKPSKSPTTIDLILGILTLSGQSCQTESGRRESC
jgi:hypothetical protein